MPEKPVLEMHLIPDNTPVVYPHVQNSAVLPKHYYS